MEIKNIVIVGAGFGGLSAAKNLSKQPGVRVLLMDQKNHHLFQPLLYQVATAGLNPGDIAVPIRAEFTDTANVEVHLEKVESISILEKKVKTAVQEFPFDYLILACGARHSYFGKAEWEEFAPGLKSLEQATEIRRRILCAFEQAENERDIYKKAALLSFVIVGGGPTGVELAGALADLSHTVLVGEFKHIDPKQTRILLVESGQRLLEMFTPALSERAKNDLRELGVTVRLNAKVTGMDGSGVHIGSEYIAAKTILWAAGVEAASVGKSLGVPLDHAGRVLVTEDLSLAGYANIFVIGDQAHFEESPGKLVPGLAPAAIQQGKTAAKNILADLRGLARKPFHYVDEGKMATIGRRRGIFERGKIHFGGLIAWVGWLFVHLVFLVSFKNRIAVFVLWIWSYLFSKRGTRLILSRDWKLDK